MLKGRNDSRTVTESNFRGTHAFFETAVANGAGAGAGTSESQGGRRHGRNVGRWPPRQRAGDGPCKKNYGNGTKRGRNDSHTDSNFGGHARIL